MTTRDPSVLWFRHLRNIESFQFLELIRMTGTYREGEMGCTIMIKCDDTL